MWMWVTEHPAGNNFIDLPDAKCNYQYCHCYEQWTKQNFGIHEIHNILVLLLDKMNKTEKFISLSDVTNVVQIALGMADFIEDTIE